MSEPRPAHRPQETHEAHKAHEAQETHEAREAPGPLEPRREPAVPADEVRERLAREDEERKAQPRRPAALLFEPGAPDPAGGDRFFDLESMDDPRELLARATELAVAFRAAADRATDFQAVAAAQLADPRRFDRLTPAALAERAGWTEDYARRMVEYGRSLLRTGGVEP